MTNKEKLEQMPECKAFIDDMREHCGDPVRIEAEENGHRVSWTKPKHVSVFVMGALTRMKRAA